MHHIIVGSDFFDHENRDKLDNRKNNLRKSSHIQNSRNKNKHSNNTSGYIGIGLDKHKKKWRARIKIQGREINLGVYSDKIEALKVRLQAEKTYYDKYAPQRHLFKDFIE